MNAFLKPLFVLFLLTSSFGFSVEHFKLQWMNPPSEEQTTYSSQEYPDAVWVIEPYFLGCPYCNDNAPRVNELKNYFQNDERVQILDVGIDKDDASYVEWIRRHKPNHPVLKDGSRRLVRQLGTSVYPSTYVLDRDLKIIFKSSGVWGTKTEAQIKNAVEKALGR